MRRFLRRLVETPAPPPGAPFAPRHRHPPLVFLHIPKTAGSSVNAALRAIYGEDGFAGHVEQILPGLPGPDGPLRRDCVSGHLPLSVWNLLPGTRAYARATLLRDPWARLVSQINWTRRYHRGEPVPPGRTGPGTARAAGIIARTDFSQADQVRAFLLACSEGEDFISFDNLQVRMLLLGGHRIAYQPLVRGDADRAFATLHGFAAVGFCDAPGPFLRDLARHAGRRAPPPALPRENVTPDRDRVLAEDNAMAREVLMPWLARDLRLWRLARAAFGGGAEAGEPG